MTGSKSVWETNTPLFYVLQVFGMCETTFPGCGITCVWECCCRVGYSITAWVPTSDPSCQEGQLTCRWTSSTWGYLAPCTQWAYGVVGNSQQPQYLLQVSSALLCSLYFLSSILCVSYRCAYLCSSRLSGALEGQKKLMELLELELQMIVSCYVGAGN